MVDVNKVDLEKLGITKEEFEDKDEEEQQKLLEEAPLPAQESETEKQIKGLLYDLKRERDRRGEAEERTGELEERIGELEKQLKEEQKKREEEIPSEDEGEYITVGAAKKLLKEVLSKREDENKEEFDQRIAGIEAVILTDRLKLSEDAAMKKYSPKEVGEELCYEKVTDAFEELVKQNPAYRAVVLSSANPAEEAYKIGLTHPDIQALLNKKAAEGVVEKLGKVKVKTGIGSSQGSVEFDASKATIDELINLKDEELEKLRRQT